MFNSSKPTHSANFSHMVFMAPERMTGNLQIQSNELSKRADIWSVGVMMCAMIQGYLPFDGDSCQQLYDNVRKADINFDSPEWFDVPYSAKALLCELLRPDAGDRIDAASAISHEFFVEAADLQEKISRGESASNDDKLWLKSDTVTCAKFIKMYD